MLCCSGECYRAIMALLLNDEARMTFDLLIYGQICVLVAVAILEECCMAFADMQ